MRVEKWAFHVYFLRGMFENRSYMRAPSSRSRWSLTSILLAVNVGAFLLECLYHGYPPRIPDNDYFALSVQGLAHGYLWQLITYQFMHAGFLHLFLNCWVIFVFGREMEAALRPKQFFTLYFASGVMGGLVQMGGALVWPSHFGGAVVGASAAALGLVAAFAALYPERLLMLLLFFIIPLTVRAKNLLLGIAIASLFCIVFPHSFLAMLLGGNIAHAAHLGGMLTGYVFAIWIFKRSRAPLEEIVVESQSL